MHDNLYSGSFDSDPQDKSKGGENNVSEKTEQLQISYDQLAELGEMEKIAEEFLSVISCTEGQHGSDENQTGYRHMGSRKVSSEESERQHLLGDNDCLVDDLFTSVQNRGQQELAGRGGPNSEQSNEDVRRSFLQLCEDFVHSFLLSESQSKESQRECEHRIRTTSPTNLFAAPNSQISKLYKNVTDCDRNLGDIQATLEKYLKRIEVIMQGIGALQKKCTETEIILQNKKTVQACVDKALGMLLVPPDLIRMVLSSCGLSLDSNSGNGRAVSTMSSGDGTVAFHWAPLGTQFSYSVKRLELLLIAWGKGAISVDELSAEAVDSKNVFLTLSELSRLFNAEEDNAPNKNSTTQDNGHQRGLVIDLRPLKVYAETRKILLPLATLAAYRIKTFIVQMIKEIFLVLAPEEYYIANSEHGHSGVGVDSNSNSGSQNTMQTTPASSNRTYMLKRTNISVQQHNVLRQYRPLMRFLRSAALVVEQDHYYLCDSGSLNEIKFYYEEVSRYYSALLQVLYRNNMYDYIHNCNKIEVDTVPILATCIPYVANVPISLGRQQGSVQPAVAEINRSSGGLTSWLGFSTPSAPKPAAPAASPTSSGLPGAGIQHSFDNVVTQLPLIDSTQLSFELSYTNKNNTGNGIDRLLMAEMSVFGLSIERATYLSHHRVVSAAPIIPHVAKLALQAKMGANSNAPLSCLENSFFETFRSFNMLLADAVTSEFLFSFDFFCGDRNVYVDCFKPTIQLCVDYVSSVLLKNRKLVSSGSFSGGGGSKVGPVSQETIPACFLPNKDKNLPENDWFVKRTGDLSTDPVGILIMLHITHCFRRVMRDERQLYCLDGYFKSLFRLFFPALKSALHRHVAPLSSQDGSKVGLKANVFASLFLTELKSGSFIVSNVHLNALEHRGLSSDHSMGSGGDVDKFQKLSHDLERQRGIDALRRSYLSLVDRVIQSLGKKSMGNENAFDSPSPSEITHAFMLTIMRHPHPITRRVAHLVAAVCILFRRRRVWNVHTTTTKETVTTTTITTLKRGQSPVKANDNRMKEEEESSGSEIMSSNSSSADEEGSEKRCHASLKALRPTTTDVSCNSTVQYLGSNKKKSMAVKNADNIYNEFDFEEYVDLRRFVCITVRNSNHRVNKQNVGDFAPANGDKHKRLSVPLTPFSDSLLQHTALQQQQNYNPCLVTLMLQTILHHLVLDYQQIMGQTVDMIVAQLGPSADNTLDRHQVLMCSLLRDAFILNNNFYILMSWYEIILFFGNNNLGQGQRRRESSIPGSISDDALLRNELEPRTRHKCEDKNFSTYEGVRAENNRHVGQANAGTESSVDVYYYHVHVYRKLMQLLATSTATPPAPVITTTSKSTNSTEHTDDNETTTKCTTIDEQKRTHVMYQDLLLFHCHSPNNQSNQGSSPSTPTESNAAASEAVIDDRCFKNVEFFTALEEGCTMARASLAETLIQFYYADMMSIIDGSSEHKSLARVMQVVASLIADSEAYSARSPISSSSPRLLEIIRTVSSVIVHSFEQETLIRTVFTRLLLYCTRFNAIASELEEFGERSSDSKNVRRLLISHQQMLRNMKQVFPGL